MCGRIACTRNGKRIRRQCGYSNQQGKRVLPQLKPSPGGKKVFPSYNISPGAHMLVLFIPADEGSQRTLMPMQWRLIPHWHKGTKEEFQLSTINCRKEKLLESNLFRTPVNRGQRCVILCDGFYEWKSEDSGKQPYFIHLSTLDTDNISNVKDEVEVSESEEETNDEINEEISDEGLMKLAAIYDTWTSPDGEIIYSYSIITLPSSPSLKSLHHRMPAILQSDDDVTLWISRDSTPAQAMKVIKQHDDLLFHPVSMSVNNSRFNGPECVVNIQSSDTKSRTKSKSAEANFMQKWLKRGENSEKSHTLKTGIDHKIVSGNQDDSRAKIEGNSDDIQIKSESTDFAITVKESHEPEIKRVKHE